MSRIPNEIYTVELTGQELCTLMADACYTEDEVETTEAAKQVRHDAIEKLKEAFFPKATKIWDEEREAK